ncbi:hypothetical protein [uncultured Erythrobacter sp.]|uniref:hypothetical protein n=1 Tax=uncultured Erythrobacter sp. TaxID=263913 RepID=UPI002605A80D|nr:hypothetical protein [uncultured Erythrobacter sp.]
MKLYPDLPIQADMSAKKLALSLLSVTDSERQSAANLVAAGALFNIEPAAMRMAITRLTKDGTLEAIERGSYKIGPNGQAMQRQVTSWKSASEKVRPWSGDWLIVHTSHLGRTDKTRLRSRERALRLSGFAETDGALWVRPNNLAASLAATRSSLVDLGLDQEAKFLVVTELAVMEGEDWTGLWSAEEIAASYSAAIQAMAQSSQKVARMSDAEAAKETLLIGQAIIRLINFDPLLPAEFIDRTGFQQVVVGMQAYNALGIECWKRYYASLS